MGERRVGHAGTLDPFATGLLLVLVGRATRLARFLATLTKRYEGVVRLGVTTSTDDATGDVLFESQRWRDIGDQEVRRALRDLEGKREQRPPVYSAKKIGGVPAHRRARRGEAVELPSSTVVIHRLRMTRREGARVQFEAEVGSGTYMRAIARDLGRSLGCGAHLVSLRREGIGPFSVVEALPLDELGRGEPVLRGVRELVGHLPILEVGDAEGERVAHGRAIRAEIATGQPVAILAGGDLVAVAEPKDGLLKPRVVLRG